MEGHGWGQDHREESEMPMETNRDEQESTASADEAERIVEEAAWQEAIQAAEDAEWDEVFQAVKEADRVAAERILRDDEEPVASGDRSAAFAYGVLSGSIPCVSPKRQPVARPQGIGRGRGFSVAPSGSQSRPSQRGLSESYVQEKEMDMLDADEASTPRSSSNLAPNLGTISLRTAFKRKPLPIPGEVCGKGVKLKITPAMISLYGMSRPEASANTRAEEQNQLGASKSETAEQQTEKSALANENHPEVDWNVVQMLTTYAYQGGNLNPDRAWPIWKRIVHAMPLADALQQALILWKSPNAKHAYVSAMIMRALLDKEKLSTSEFDELNPQLFCQVVKSLAPEMLREARKILFQAYKTQIRSLVSALHDKSRDWPTTEENGFVPRIFPKQGLLKSFFNNINGLPNLYMHSSLHFLEGSLSPAFDLENRSYFEWKHLKLSKHLGLWKDKDLFEKFHPLTNLSQVYDYLRQVCLMAFRCSRIQVPYYFYYDLIRMVVVEVITYVCEFRQRSTYSSQEQKLTAARAKTEIEDCPMHHHQQYDYMYDFYDVKHIIEGSHWPGKVGKSHWKRPAEERLFFRRQSESISGEEDVT